jgi:membrane protease subunit (stomatin/prohibitin family)
MARTTSTRSNRVDPTRPFYAAVGSVDAAVAYARNGLSEAQSRLSKVDLEPRAIPGRAQKLVNDYVADLGETVEDLNKQYVDLAQRGRTLLNRIRRQQATQDLKSSAGTTRSTARSTAKRTAASTRRTAGAAKRTAGTATGSARATGTSARKTASAAGKATRSAAGKTGA